MTSAISPTLSLERLQQLVSSPEQMAGQLMQILASLASEDEEVRAYANDCLEQIEQPSHVLASKIALQCEDPHVPVVNWACKLLGRIGTTDCQLPLVKVLKNHESMGIKQQAALSLSNIPQLQADAIDALATAARSTDPRLQRIAQQTLNTLS